MAASPKAMQKVAPKSPIVTEHVGVLSLHLVSGALLGAADPVLTPVTTDDGGSNGVYAYFFDDGAVAPEIVINGTLPEHYVPGSDLYVELIWANEDDSAGDISVNLEYVVTSADGSSHSGEFSTVIEEVLSMPEVASTVNRTLILTIDGADVEPGDLVMFRLWRDPTDDDDDYAAGVWFVSLEVKFNANMNLLKRKYLDLA